MTCYRYEDLLLRLNDLLLYEDLLSCSVDCAVLMMYLLYVTLLAGGVATKVRPPHAHAPALSDSPTRAWAHAIHGSNSLAFSLFFCNRCTTVVHGCCFWFGSRNSRCGAKVVQYGHSKCVFKYGEVELYGYYQGKGEALVGPPGCHLVASQCSQSCLWLRRVDSSLCFLRVLTLVMYVRVTSGGSRRACASCPANFGCAVIIYSASELKESFFTPKYGF